MILLLHHDESFTKGIILNRPSALELDGWRVWFGGDVAEGGVEHPARPPLVSRVCDGPLAPGPTGMFRGERLAKGEREIVCLHSLEGEVAERLSMPVWLGSLTLGVTLGRVRVREG